MGFSLFCREADVEDLGGSISVCILIVSGSMFEIG